MHTALLLFFSYILGSIPVGVLLGRLSGIDVRQTGSGNIGATNVARSAGWKLGLGTLLGDTGKGFIPVYLSLQLELDPAITSLTALAAFFGHLYPIFLRFQGGKGVATALGVIFGLAPAVVPLLLVVFVVVAMLSRFVSLASIIAGSTAPVLLWILNYPGVFTGAGLVMALMIAIRHLDNLRRLRAGVEPKFQLR